MMTTAVLENVCRSYQNCHEFLFMNVNALVSSFCFSKFVKIPQNVSPLSRFLL